MIIKTILTNVLNSIYESCGFAIIMAVLCMFVYQFAKEVGWKTIMYKWRNEFILSKKFRYLCLLCINTNIIVYKNLLNRSIWVNPVENVIGVWGLYNSKGEFTTDAVENFVLFIPFAILLLWCFQNKILGQAVKIGKTIWQSIKIVFLFSLAIEFLQLFLRLGTFQLSDLFYNTLGGFVGGFTYWVGYKIVHRKKEV